MEQKRITLVNSAHQQYDIGIEEYDDYIVIDRLLSVGTKIVEIPDVINEKPVRAIGDDCFFNCRELKEVQLTDSIVSIGAEAFALCKGITEIIIPDSVKEIGHHALRDCRSLKKVVMSKEIKCLPVGVFAFCYLHNPEIVLPEGLEEIEEGAFWSAGVFDLHIPDSVKKIGIGAFNRGPRPITKLPYDKGWDLQWPYGEMVTVDNVRGKITDLHFLERSCELHEVTVGEKVKLFFYPCDYLERIIKFEEEDNQQRISDYIEHIWKSENDLSVAYKIRDAWKRGLI